MKILKPGLVFRVTLAYLFFLLIAAFPCNATEIDANLAKCAKLNNDHDARLKCFDELAKCTEIKDDANRLKCFENLIKRDKLTVIEKHWDMSPIPEERNVFVLTPYRPNYFLPLAYNSSPNRDTNLDFDPNAKAQYNEVKFQLSFKFKIWEDLFRGSLKEIIKENSGIKGIDVWIAYTQQSFWQLYNSAFSAPFRDTNYEPELLLNLRMQHEFHGLMEGTKLQFINVGFNHQSNGRSVPLSRSWNRIVANAGLEKTFGTENNDSFGLLLKTWVRLPEDETNDDNPDISKYVGYGELWGTLYWEKQRFALMLRNNLRSDNLGAVQLDWSFPLPLIGDKLNGYIQYFNGYGEGLLDYNKSINRISAGFMLVDWK